MQIILMNMLKNIVAAVVGPQLFLFIAKAVVKRTDNLLDDNFVGLVEGGMKNDPELIKTSAEALIEGIGDYVKEEIEKK